MAAKRFTKTAIDWTAFAEQVGSHEKAKFLQFKAKTDRYMKKYKYIAYLREGRCNSKFIVFELLAEREYLFLYIGRATLMSYPEKSPTIDWALYRSRINPALVDDFEKKYNSLKVAFPADKLTPSIDEQAKVNARDTKEFIELSELRIKLHEKTVEWWKKMIPFDEMTMDEYKDYFPDLAPDFLGKPNFWPYDQPPTPVFPYRDNKPH